MAYARTVDNNIVSAREVNTSNKGWFICYHLNYQHNYTYLKNLREGYMYNSWQKVSDVLKWYNKIPRKIKKNINGNKR